LKSEQSFSFKKFVFVFENIENQIVEIVEKEAIENCYLLRDLVAFSFSKKFCIVVQG
jgi:hypothetical protein